MKTLKFTLLMNAHLPLLSIGDRRDQLIRVISRRPLSESAVHVLSCIQDTGRKLTVSVL